MTKFGYHASHEQFPPSELVSNVVLAEQAGFDCAKSSDHFHPWSEKQGQSGFAWAWLGAVMQASALPMGVISAAGYRYHPAVLAQAAATIGEMFPGRLWLALGSGEAINEGITGLYWPEKAERNAVLLECIEVVRALLAGEKVTHRGRVTVIEAKLYSRPETPPPLYGAAITEATAELCGGWADGLLTTGADVETLRKTIRAFHRGGGEGKPVILQSAISWAKTEEEAEAQAVEQWGPCAIGGEVNWDLRRPADFDMASSLVRAEEIRKSVKVSHDLAQHAAWLAEFAALGFAEIHIHPVGRNQRACIEAFGHKVLPQLRS